MKIYYAGSLFDNRSSNYSKFIFYSKKDRFFLSDYKPHQLNITPSEYAYLKQHLQNYRATGVPIDSRAILEILYKIDLFSRPVSSWATIIFEIIESEDGIKYGKEILSGLLFPLELYPTTEYYFGKDGSYCIEVNKIYEDPNLARFKYILSINEVASINMVERYKNKTNKERNDFIDSIRHRYNENVFKKQIVEKETNALLEQNILTKLMEEIEYLLQLIKANDIYTYNNLSLEYRKLKSNDTLIATDPSKKQLENFLANVKLTLLVSENKNENLSEYLTDIYIKYFNRMYSNELNNQDLNINDIDILSEMFLINKDNYSVVAQREILIKFSMLYLLITKANINNINIENLKESYFSKNLKTIALCIFDLCECDVITTPINITPNDNITVESIIEIIKTIEFNKDNIEAKKKFLK